jgi:hypothetical protein
MSIKELSYEYIPLFIIMHTFVVRDRLNITYRQQHR